MIPLQIAIWRTYRRNGEQYLSIALAADQFVSVGRDIEIEIMPSGTYRLTPDASTETLQIEFFI